MFNKKNPLSNFKGRGFVFIKVVNLQNVDNPLRFNSFLIILSPQLQFAGRGRLT